MLILVFDVCKIHKGRSDACNILFNVPDSLQKAELIKILSCLRNFHPLVFRWNENNQRTLIFQMGFIYIGFSFLSFHSVLHHGVTTVSQTCYNIIKAIKALRIPNQMKRGQDNFLKENEFWLQIFSHIEAIFGQFSWDVLNNGIFQGREGWGDV